MILRSARLAVELGEPGGEYRGTRFDWTGRILQVTLDGKHTFCTPESLIDGEGTGGIGLCNEFGIFVPVGYDDAKLGEEFPKIGVGLLTRQTNDSYSFITEYPLKPFPIRIERDDNRVIYTVDSLPCRGYEMTLQKTLELIDNRLLVSYVLENTGTKPIHTHEYNHNFVAIDGLAPGPDYILHLAKGIVFKPGDLSPLLVRDDGNIRWKSIVPEAFLSPARGPFTVKGPAWELIHTVSGVGMRETVDFPIYDFNFFCAPHLIAPEVFTMIDLEPGHRKLWSRQYEFFTVRD